MYLIAEEEVYEGQHLWLLGQCPMDTPRSKLFPEIKMFLFFFHHRTNSQVRTQLDSGNVSVAEKYKTRLLEPEEVAPNNLSYSEFSVRL